MSPFAFALAIAPAAAIVWFVYTRDLYDREPAGVLALSFLLGIVSVVPAIIGSLLGGHFFDVSENPVITAAYAFGVVALSEEVAKFLFLRYVVFRHPAFDEPYDGIVYAVMIGMGFATFENILYVADGGLQVAFLRMFTAVPAHAVFGVAMGYWVGLAKFDPAKRKAYITRGLLVAILLHGAYDFFLMQDNIPGLALLSFLGLYAAVKWSLKAIRTHNEISPFQDREND